MNTAIITTIKNINTKIEDLIIGNNTNIRITNIMIIIALGQFMLILLIL